MEKNLKLVIELLDIKSKNIENVAKIIEENTEKKIVISHKYGQILKSFQDFLNKKVSQEQFITIGDIDKVDNTQYHKYQKETSLDILENILYQTTNKKDIEKNTIFILDQKISNIDTIDKINNKLQEHGSYLVFLD